MRNKIKVRVVASALTVFGEGFFWVVETPSKTLAYGEARTQEEATENAADAHVAILAEGVRK